MLMIKILIADDHTMVREGLKQVLMATDDILVAAEAANNQEVLDKIWKADFDMLVLEIAMLGSSGLDILKEIKRHKPELGILVLSMYPEDHYAIRALRAGADGYLTKESTSNDLITVIRKVYSGKKYISPYLAEKLAFEFDAEAVKPPHELLSNLEYQIMCQISSCRAVKDIASKLSLSVKTIGTYRARILEKMGMKHNAELTYYAIHNHLVDLNTDSSE
jgi:two-component system, NarL family, invasion response regulator UvrY